MRRNFERSPLIQDSEMKTFRVLLNGRNFYLKLDGEIKHLGFFTTRYVFAASPEDAEEAAVHLIRNDEWLKTATQNRKDDPPRLYADEIEEVVEVPSEDVSGFAYYPGADDTDV